MAICGSIATPGGNIIPGSILSPEGSGAGKTRRGALEDAGNRLPAHQRRLSAQRHAGRDPVGPPRASEGRSLLGRQSASIVRRYHRIREGVREARSPGDVRGRHVRDGAALSLRSSGLHAVRGVEHDLVPVELPGDTSSRCDVRSSSRKANSWKAGRSTPAWPIAWALIPEIPESSTMPPGRAAWSSLRPCSTTSSRNPRP